MSDANGLLNGLNGATANLIKDTTTANFQNDVIAESRNQPVLVDFWAPWCGPCKQLGPILEKTVTEAKGAIKLVKMNTDDHPSVAGQLGIRSLPAVVAFVDGQPVDAFMGAVPESEVKAFIAKLGNKAGTDEIATALQAAEELLKAGDTVQAADIFAAILQNAPDTIAAVAGLATCLLESGEADKAKAILDTAPQDKKQDPLLSALYARIALGEQLKTLGDPIELKKRIDANPKDYQARFDLALIHNAQGERAKAADDLLDIMKAAPEWNDDGARKQLLQFFEFWGPMDEVTLSARRKLSSMLFS